jgi:hypothetical protein
MGVTTDNVADFVRSLTIGRLAEARAPRPDWHA